MPSTHKGGTTLSRNKSSQHHNSKITTSTFLSLVIQSNSNRTSVQTLTTDTSQAAHLQGTAAMDQPQHTGPSSRRTRETNFAGIVPLSERSRMDSREAPGQTHAGTVPLPERSRMDTREAPGQAYAGTVLLPERSRMDTRDAQGQLLQARSLPERSRTDTREAQAPGLLTLPPIKRKMGAPSRPTLRRALDTLSPTTTEPTRARKRRPSPSWRT